MPQIQTPQLTFEQFLNRCKREQKYYPAFKGKTLNEEYLFDLWKRGFSPVAALNALIEAT